MAGLDDWPYEAHGSRVLSSSMYEALFWQSVYQHSHMSMW